MAQATDSKGVFYMYGYPPQPQQQLTPEQMQFLNQRYQSMVPNQQVPMMGQQAVQPVPQVAPKQPTWVQVNGVQGAREITVAPSTTLWLMDSNQPVFYVKSADNLGISKLQAYQFSEIPLDAPAPTAQAAPSVDMSQFVTHDELEQFATKLQSMIPAPKQAPAKRAVTTDG